MNLTPVAQAIAVAATRLGVAASVQAKGVAAQIVVSPIKLSYELGMWLIRLAKADAVNASDAAGAVSQMFIRFFKTQTDNAQLADEIAMDFYKALTEEAGLTDLKILNFFKSLADSAAAMDLMAVEMSRPVADQFSVLEASVKDFGKALTESADVSDLEVFSFFKTLADESSVSDIAVTEVGKNADDSAGFTDEAYRDFTKAIFDQVSVTDDWDGAASVDDDQSMHFEKQVTDVAAVGDLLDRVVAFVRSFEDAAQITDATTFDAGKVLSETGLFTDSDIRFDQTKELEDSPAVEELISKEFTPEPKQDSFAVIDDFSKSPGAVKTDSASFTDTGSLRSQGYCDFSYFAEDYVGASRTF